MHEVCDCQMHAACDTSNFEVDRCITCMDLEPHVCSQHMTCVRLYYIFVLKTILAYSSFQNGKGPRSCPGFHQAFLLPDFRTPQEEHILDPLLCVICVFCFRAHVHLEIFPVKQHQTQTSTDTGLPLSYGPWPITTMLGFDSVVRHLQTCMKS